MTTSHDVGRIYLECALRMLRTYRTLGERAMGQCEDGDLFHTLDPEANSIAIIVKHLAGNMRSRWTDFLTSDGEKPDRSRDSEFELASATRDDVWRWWEDGWKLVFTTIESLQPDDLLRTAHIRGEPMTVLDAIERQVAHYASHVGQIVLLAKHRRSANWQPLSIPRGRSAEYLASVPSPPATPREPNRPPR